MITLDEARAIQAQPYEPWAKAQRTAHDAAVAAGWTPESSNPSTVTYRRGTRDYVSIQVAVGEISWDDGHFTGNGRIVHAAAPNHYFTTWAQITKYVSRPKGARYNPRSGQL